MNRLAKPDIVRALESLASELPGDGPRQEILIVGGAAIVLLYGARETTKDVDMVPVAGAIAPLRQAAARVAEVLGLPDDWLNDGAKGYVHEMATGEVLLDRPTLLVRAAATEQLLAMKLSAWRDDLDVADARLLLSKLGLERSIIWKKVERHLLPGRELKARYAFDDLWEALHESR